MVNLFVWTDLRLIPVCTGNRPHADAPDGPLAVNPRVHGEQGRRCCRVRDRRG